MKRLFRSTGFKIVLGVCWVPLAAEVWLRVLNPVPMLPRYVCAMPYGVRGNEPNREYWHRTSEYRVRIHTNSRGIRADREIPYEKPPGVKRIVLLGDSFGMGYGVDIKDTFTHTLEQSLREDWGIEAEVVNLSTSGFGNAEELVVLQAEGLKYQPDLVLLAWHVTDFDDNLRSNLFALEDGRLVRRAETYLPAVGIRESLFQSRLYRFLAEHSNLYNCLRDWAGYRVKQQLAAYRAWQVRRSGRAPTEEEKARRRQVRQDLTQALLQRIQAVAQEAGAGFLLLDIPIKKSRTSFQSAFPQEWADQFDVVSPITRFEAEGQGRKLYWEHSHGHWTPLGCRIVGRQLAEHIARNGLLGGPGARAQAAERSQRK